MIKDFYWFWLDGEKSLLYYPVKKQIKFTADDLLYIQSKQTYDLDALWQRLDRRRNLVFEKRIKIKRDRSRKFISHNGKMHSLTSLSKQYWMKYQKLYARLYTLNMPIDEALIQSRWKKTV
jgi:hypothetical protein